MSCERAEAWLCSRDQTQYRTIQICQDACCCTCVLCSVMTCQYILTNNFVWLQKSDTKRSPGMRRRVLQQVCLSCTQLDTILNVMQMVCCHLLLRKRRMVALQNGVGSCPANDAEHNKH